MDQKPNWPRFGICVAAGLSVWLLPMPEGLKPKAWLTFSVFIGVIAGFLLRPVEMGPIVLMGLTTLIASSAVTITDVVTKGFGDKVVWLVVCAFLIAAAVEGTGLGRRLALTLIRLLGRSLLGLGYAIAATEIILAPFVPSNTARGGGIISPIVKSLAAALDSRSGGESRRTGAFLVQTGAHANLVSSAMFLTAMAGSSLIVEPAQDFLGVEWDFAMWAYGSLVPGFAAMFLVPLTVRWLERPVAQNVARAHEQAVVDLKKLGKWTRREVTLGCILMALLVLWSFSKSLGLHSTTVAFLGILAIVLTGTFSWREMLGTRGAWDALIWLGGFVALAEALKSTGFVAWFGLWIKSRVGGGSPIVTILVLAHVYFFSMYFFSQLTAHISALVGIFFMLAGHAETPPLLAVAIISYYSNLCGLTTPWSSGPVIIYFGFGYVSVKRWMRNGLAAALVQIAVWMGIGMLWWKLIGWW